MLRPAPSTPFTARSSHWPCKRCKCCCGTPRADDATAVTRTCVAQRVHKHEYILCCNIRMVTSATVTSLKAVDLCYLLRLVTASSMSCHQVTRL